MKLIKIWLFMAMAAMALAVNATTITDRDEGPGHDQADNKEVLLNKDSTSTISDELLPLHAYDDLHGINSAAGRRLMAESSAYKQQSRLSVVTCDKVPRVCMGKGSMGPDCCKKKCVDTWSDGYNCGWCGKKCKYSERCCGGKCVNVMVDYNHCGKCNKKKKGIITYNNYSSCVYGICSYA